MANGLVPSIAPLVQSLQRFTPDAREDRAFKLAGLEQEQDIRSAQLQQVQASNKRQQILDIANESRVEFIKDRSDLDFVLKGGPEGLRNSIARLAATKEEGDPDLAELIDFANQATADPDEAFKVLTDNRANISRGLSTIDEILGRTQPSGFTLSEGQQRFDASGNVIATGSAGGRDDPVPAEQRAFEALISGFTPQQQKNAKLIKAGLKGRAMSNALLSAIESGDVTNLADAKAEIKQAEKFAELTGASRAKAIDKGFESIVKIDAGVRNIDRAIAALDKGAGVGAVEKLWPSIKAASVELDNIRGQMALDVVGATTFGALSKGELDLAKDIALPTGLNTDELKDHLERKKVAQEKLRAYYNEQIQFLDEGGTVASFLREKERGQGGQPQGQPVQTQTGQPQTQRLVFNPQTGQLEPK